MWPQPRSPKRYTPQHVGTLAGCSANYVQECIRRGLLHAEIAPSKSGKTHRFWIAEDVAQRFVTWEQRRRARLARVAEKGAA